MVPPLALLGDVLSIAGFFLMLPVTLAVLYLVAWREIGVAERIGVNQDVFWLLLLGGSVGWIGNIPIFLWGNSIMAVNVGGALAPVGVSLFLLTRHFRPDTPGGTVYVIGGWAEASVISVFLLIFGFPWFSLPLVFVLGALAVYTVSGRGLQPSRGSVSTLAQYSMLATATVGTYLTTYVVLGSGIVSPFPFVLFPPVLMAAMSVLFLRGDASAPGLAYATATLGCMIGADFLHQPELYAPGTGAFFGAIGGAGPLDLVYLSGLLALSAALLLLPVARHLRAGTALKSVSRQPNPLREAVSSYERGDYSAVGRKVVEGIQEEAMRTRRLLNHGIPRAPSEGPVNFHGFHFHPAVQQDFDSLAWMVGQGTHSPERSWKALVSGFFLRRALEEACKSRLALPMDRAKAFLLDLVITMGPAALLLFALYRAMHLDGLDGALASLDYQAAIYGTASYPLLVFGVSEWRTGSSLGVCSFTLGLLRCGTPRRCYN